MPILRPALRALALAVAITGGAAGARAAETAKFDLYVAGIRAGTMSIDADQTQTSYSAKARIDAAGVLGALLTFKYDASSSGAITSKGVVVPSRFQARSITPGSDHTTKIDWKNGKPVKVSIIPPRDNAPDPAEMAGTLDPVAATVSALLDAPKEKLCDTSVRVFDGSRVSLLKFGPRVAEGTGFTCAGTYARIKGAAHTASGQREFPFKLVFVPGTGGLSKLERIETSTGFGKAVLQRRA